MRHCGALPGQRHGGGQCVAAQSSTKLEPATFSCADIGYGWHPLALLHHPNMVLQLHAPKPSQTHVPSSMLPECGFMLLHTLGFFCCMPQTVPTDQSSTLPPEWGSLQMHAPGSMPLPGCTEFWSLCSARGMWQCGAEGTCI